MHFKNIAHFQTPIIQYFLLTYIDNYICIVSFILTHPLFIIQLIAKHSFCDVNMFCLVVRFRSMICEPSLSSWKRPCKIVTWVLVHLSMTKALILAMWMLHPCRTAEMHPQATNIPALRSRVIYLSVPQRDSKHGTVDGSTCAIISWCTGKFLCGSPIQWEVGNKVFLYC